MGFPGGSEVKNPPDNAGATGDVGLIPRSGKSPEEEMAAHSSILAWESQGHRSLASFSPWDCKESDVIEYSIAQESHEETQSNGSQK